MLREVHARGLPEEVKPHDAPAIRERIGQYWKQSIPERYIALLIQDCAEFSVYDFGRACDALFRATNPRTLPSVSVLANEVRALQPADKPRGDMTQEERDKRALAERFLRADWTIARQKGEPFDEEHARTKIAFQLGDRRDTYVNARASGATTEEFDAEQDKYRKLVAKALYGDPERFREVPTRADCKEAHQLRLAKLRGFDANFD